MSYFRLVVALARARRRKRRPQLPTLSSIALVNTDLNPRGSVLANTELWNAETINGNSIRRDKTVTIVGFRNHLLLVEERS